MNIHDELRQRCAPSRVRLPITNTGGHLPGCGVDHGQGPSAAEERLSGSRGCRSPARRWTVLVLGLTGVLGPAETSSTIRTAAFTLASNANGTATLTINPKELLDPAALQSDLAQYGIPAKVTSGSFCSSDPAPAGFSQVVLVSPAGEQVATPQPAAEPTITIDPAAMPARARSSASATSSSPRASSRPTFRSHRHQFVHLQQHPA